MQIGVAIVEFRNQFLVGVRHSGAPLAGMLEFPGGKCEPDESPAACAIRECLEETGLRVEVVELLSHVRHEYPHGLLDLSFFLCRLADSAVTLPTGGFQWLPVDRMPPERFPEANRDVIARIRERWLPRLPEDHA